MNVLSFVAAALIACGLGIGNTQAFAESGLIGEWQTQDGAANIAIKPCGANLCGYVSWSKEGAAFVGSQVLVNMKPDGRMWRGTVINVANGQNYAARMSLQSAETLKIEGCVMGGMICGGQRWSRVK
jgi:uncharacterized protein (DUF2147 family)